jgi:predicted nucleic acid-binding Zn ribbon protein
MTDHEEDELKTEKLKKEAERKTTRLVWLGVIVLLLVVIIIGLIFHYSPTFK